MTKRKNMSAAQRQVTVEKKVEQLEMATRVSQMLLQQVGNSTNQVGRDISELATRQRDVQYRVLALQELLGVKIEDLEARAEELQVKDFNEVSDKEDLEKGYTIANTVTEDSVVIITTKVENQDENNKGILRSKLILADLAFPKLKEDLLGKSVGDDLTADINGTKHQIKVLGIRSVPEEVADAVPVLTEVKNEQPTEANG